MKVLSIVILMFVSCLFTFSAHAGEKVAVLDFKSILAPEDLGIAVAEILRTELVGLGDYTVIERGMLEQVMQEQSLQLTGAVDSETAVEIGKLVGAKLVVTGSIVKTGSVYTINARFIDVETSIAKVGQNIRGQGEDEISNMVHQLALIITGKAVVTEDTVPAEKTTPKPEPTPAPVTPQGGATVLFSFETQEEIRQWQSDLKRSSVLSLSEDHATDGTHSLRLTILKSDDWQGIGTTNIPEDWAPYQIFAFDLYYNTKQEDAVWRLAVRIDDQQTTRIKRDWFMKGYVIEPGATTIRIYIEDIGKRLDTRQIKQVTFATNKLEHDAEVYLDNIRFENVLPLAPTEPFILSFEKKVEVPLNWRSNGRLIQLGPSKQYATHGEHSLQVDLPRKLPGNQYPGILSHTFPRDWSNYTQFSADIYYDSREKDTVMLGVRIDDMTSSSYESRFNWEIELKPGTNKIRIPIETITNAIDITRIQVVYIFLEEPKKRTTLYLDNIRVE